MPGLKDRLKPTGDRRDMHITMSESRIAKIDRRRAAKGLSRAALLEELVDAMEELLGPEDEK